MRFAQAFVRNARHVILVADAMLTSRTAPMRLGHMTQIDTLVTDQQLPAPLEEVCRAGGVDVIIASP